jgi:hypothetical protein
MPAIQVLQASSRDLDEGAAAVEVRWTLQAVQSGAAR